MGQNPRPLDPGASARHRLGAELRHWRELRGWSQARLGERLHVSADLIGKVEKADRWPSEEVVTACDSVLQAGGRLAALVPEVERQRLHERRPVTMTQLPAPAGPHAISAPPGLDVLRRAATTGGAQAPDLGTIQRQLLAAHRARLFGGDSRPMLLLIGGYAGSGKTELGELLARMTGWPLLDKDRLTRPLVEHLLLAHGADPNDRHSATYLREVRPAEYRCLMNTAFDQLNAGTSVILTAPFLRELPDAGWLRRVTSRCSDQNIDTVPIWVDADLESMYAYMVDRDAARDSWKLEEWDAYTALLDLALRPAVPHLVVDNGRDAAVSLSTQAAQLRHIFSGS